MSEELDIFIGCSSIVFTKEEESQIIDELNHHGLVSRVESYDSQMLASLDIFAPVIEFFTSPTLTQKLLDGIVPALIIEGLKFAILQIWKICRKKPLYRLTSTSCKQVEPGFQFVIGSNRLVIPETADAELVVKTTEMFLAAVNQQHHYNETYYYTLDPNHKRLFYRTYDQIIQDEIAKHSDDRK